MIHKIWRSVLFFLYYFIFLFGPSVAKMTHHAPAMRINFNNVHLLLAMALNSILMLVFALLLLRKKEMIHQKKTQSHAGLFAWCVLILFCLFAANSLLSLLGKALHWPHTGAQGVTQPAKALYLPIALLCLLIGYSEEALFRRDATDIFPFLSVPAAHIIMSLLFGLAHIAQGWIAVLFSMAAGGIFAFFYVFLSRKYGPIGWHCLAITHGAYNFIMIALAGRI